MTTPDELKMFYSRFAFGDKSSIKIPEVKLPEVKLPEVTSRTVNRKQLHKPSIPPPWTHEGREYATKGNKNITPPSYYISVNAYPYPNPNSAHECPRDSGSGPSRITPPS